MPLAVLGCRQYVHRLDPSAPEVEAPGSATGDDTLDRWPRHVAIGAGAYALAAGVIAIAGWAFDMPRLTDWRNDGISMFPNTALCAALSGAALLLASVATWGRTAVRAPAAFVASLGGLTLLEHLTGVSFGIDTLLFERSWGQAAAAAPMRMGPPASLSFLLAGLALGLLTGGSAGPPGERATQRDRRRDRHALADRSSVRRIADVHAAASDGHRDADRIGPRRARARDSLQPSRAGTGAYAAGSRRRRRADAARAAHHRRGRARAGRGARGRRTSGVGWTARSEPLCGR